MKPMENFTYHLNQAIQAHNTVEKELITLMECNDIEIRQSRRYFFQHNPANTMLADIFNRLLVANGTFELDAQLNEQRELASLTA